MNVERDYQAQNNLAINDEVEETVDKFIYLGANITNNYDDTKEVRTTIT